MTKAEIVAETRNAVEKVLKAQVKNAVTAMSVETVDGVGVTVFKRDNGQFFYKLDGRWFSNVQSERFFSSESEAKADAKKRIAARAKM